MSNVVYVPPRFLKETPENWTIYRKPSASDPAFIELCESVLEHGINTPLEVSSDNYVISGHRRLLAALESGIEEVPCLFDKSVVMEEMSGPDRIALLVERNKGTRIKSPAEQYLEAAAAVDPEQAIREAQARKAEVLNKVKTCGLGEVEIIGSISRTDPSGERKEMLDAVLAILEEKRKAGFLPTSGRHIHYSLFNKKVRTSSRKTGYIYGTRRGSDALMSKLLTDARSSGLINVDAINDDTRPTEAVECSGTVGKYVSDETERLFKGYFSDLHADQKNHVEILVEKNTVLPLLSKHVARPMRVPITSMHGYGSFPAARDVAKRFKESGKDNLVVIYVSDLDPEGINMPASWKKYLEHDFGVEATVLRAAVTPEQVKRFNLPPDADVKLTSPRAAGFVKEYGDQCWELDSMPEADLISEVLNAVKSQLDIDAFNAALARENDHDVELDRLRAKVAAFVANTCQKENQ